LIRACHFEKALVRHTYITANVIKSEACGCAGDTFYSFYNLLRYHGK